MDKKTIPVAVIALFLGAAAGTFVVQGLKSTKIPALDLPREGWTEVQWPFALDQFGRGKAYRCDAARCGTPITLHVRAKIGFCNCTTGVADDAELERIGDLSLLDRIEGPKEEGRQIEVAWMKGRSRSYALSAGNPHGNSAISIAYNDRCDAIVALVIVGHQRTKEAEASAIELLNSPTVMRWAATTLGL